MKRPEVIWIGPFPFDIYFDHVRLAVITTNDNVQAAVGASHSDQLRIVIDDRLPEPRQRDVLIHEVLHAIWSFTGIRNADELNEELVIDALSAPWLYVLRVNPDFTEYLIHGSAADTPEARNTLETLRVLHEQGVEDLDEAEAVGEEADEEGEVAEDRQDRECTTTTKRDPCE